MARTFVRASSQALEVASVPTLAYPYSLSCLVRPAAVNVLQTAFGVGDTTAKYSVIGIDGTARAFAETTGNGVAFSDSFRTGALTASAWTQIGAVHTSTTAHLVYGAGTAGTNDTTSITMPVVTRTTIGALRNAAALASFFGGDIAECGIWNVALTASDMAVLALGVSPLLVRPDALVFYAPVWGRATVEQELKASRGLTQSGTPAVAPHPLVLTPPSGLAKWKTAAAGGATPVSVVPSTPAVVFTATAAALAATSVTPAAAAAAFTAAATATAATSVTPASADARFTASATVVTTTPIDLGSVTSTAAFTAAAAARAATAVTPAAATAVFASTGSVTASPVVAGTAATVFSSAAAASAPTTVTPAAASSVYGANATVTTPGTPSASSRLPLAGVGT